MDNIVTTESGEGYIYPETGEVISEGPLQAPKGVSVDVWNKWMDEKDAEQDMFLWELRRGLKGHNVGLGNGLKRVNKYIYGTQKARYYLLGADSGVGKTTIADFMFVLKAYENARARNKPIKVFYCSFEIGKTAKIWRWCSYYIIIKYGIQLSSDYLRGAIEDHPVKREHVNMILEAYSYITEMLKYITVVENAFGPTDIFEGIVEGHFTKHGTVLRGSVTDEEAKRGVKGLLMGYKENDPNLITIMVIDHLALAGQEGMLSTKATMDKLSRYLIVLRNMFYCTVVVVQQFSTDMMSTYRDLTGKKKSDAAIAPQRIDFGDSKATYRDANVVMGFVKPQKEMKTFMGYDISEAGLGECFVAGYLMKNREGPSNRVIPLFIDGISGYVYDLPNSGTPEILSWHQKAKQIEELCQVFSPR